MTGPLRAILGLGALLVAYRLFFPLESEGRFGLQLDFLATLLQVLAILILTAAAYFLVPPVETERILRFFSKIVVDSFKDGTVL